MKHNLRITILLVAMFFAAQVIGLLILTKYVDAEKTNASGELAYKELPYNVERPEINGTWSFLYIIVAVLIGTILALILIKYRKKNLWMIWFFLASWFCLSIAFSALIKPLLAAILAFMLALWKVLRSNFFVHNITELFMYAGIAAIFVPLMSLTSAIILLLLISVYDAIAVWKTKHMITLAESEEVVKVFPGLSVPYFSGNKVSGKKMLLNKQTALTLKKGVRKDMQPSSHRGHPGKQALGLKRAVLGGGDIAFPLLFAGAAMKTLGLENAIIISAFASLALFILFLKAEKGKYYPAMPFISAGCLAGLGFVFLLRFVSQSL